MQSLYDDGSLLLATVQSIRRPEKGQSWRQCDLCFDHLDNLALALKTNLGVVQQSFEALLSIGHDQADMAQGDYNGSIEWRMSRLSVIDTQFGGAHRPLSNFDSYGDEDMVDMEMAFQKPGMKAHTSVDTDVYRNGSLVPETGKYHADGVANHAGAAVSGNTRVPISPLSPADSFGSSPSFDEDRESCDYFDKTIVLRYTLQLLQIVVLHLAVKNSKSCSDLMHLNITLTLPMRKQNLGTCGQRTMRRRFL